MVPTLTWGFVRLKFSLAMTCFSGFRRSRLLPARRYEERAEVKKFGAPFMGVANPIARPLRSSSSEMPRGTEGA
jgi:hypothetical protein